MSYNPNPPLGQATKANSLPNVLASDDDIQAKLGIVTETAPGTDTASSGLNGRLQRIAQRLTSLIAQIPAALGQTTKSGSMSVTIASDQDPAHDAADSGNPIKVGGRALDLGVTPTAVAANDRVDAAFLRNRIQLVLNGHPNIVTKNFQVTDADGAQTNADILGAVSAGTAVVVTKVSVMAANSNTVDVSCRIGFGTSTVPAADSAGIVFYHPGIAKGSGAIEGNGSAIIGIGASDEELRVTCDDPVSGSISIIVTYFTIAIG